MKPRKRKTRGICSFCNKAAQYVYYEDKEKQHLHTSNWFKALEIIRKYNRNIKNVRHYCPKCLIDKLGLHYFKRRILLDKLEDGKIHCPLCKAAYNQVSDTKL